MAQWVVAGDVGFEVVDANPKEPYRADPGFGAAEQSQGSRRKGLFLANGPNGVGIIALASA